MCVTMAHPQWAGRVGSRKARRFLDPVCQPARFRPPQLTVGKAEIEAAIVEVTG